jgi:ABC-type transport system involved in multi-copper enzyme maturation permease subunit
VNRGLLFKSIRETWPTTLFFALPLFFVTMLLGFVMPKFQSQLSMQIMGMPFFRDLVSAMLGSDVSGGIGPEMFAAIAWVHPVVLALVWGHAMVLAVRLPAGEVESGTIDILVALPVSRWQVFGVSSFVALVGSVALVTSALFGNVIGAMLGGNAFGIPFERYVPVAVNLLAMTVAVGSFASLASAFSSRRGRALSVALLVVLVSFLVNYLARFWEPAHTIAWLSVLQYHQPVRVLQSGAWPWLDIVVLVGATAGLWVAAGLVFARRDLATT